MNKLLKSLSQNIVTISIVLAILIALNYLAIKFPLRLDLTQDKEFSLSPSTKTVLSKLEDRLTIKLYFSKNLPPQLVQIQEAVADLLKELKANAKQTIIIENVDPDSNEAKESETQALGIMPLELNIVEKDKREIKKAYLGMAIYYQDKKEVIPVVAQLETLEYNIDQSVLKLATKNLPKIGVIAPPVNPQDPESDVYQISKSMVSQIGTAVNLSYDDKALVKNQLKALLVLEPHDVTSAFVNELDQVLKQGVNVLIFAGEISVNNGLVATSFNSGLGDWLATKGISIDSKLVVDPLQNAQAGIKSGMMQLYVPYPFWIKVFPKELNQKNPITARLEEILFPWSNTVELQTTKDSVWQPEVLVSSSRGSFLQQDESPDVTPEYLSKMTQMPEMKSYPLSVVFTNKDPQFGKLFITASHALLQDNFLQQENTNAIFLQNMVEYATWGDQLIDIRSRGKSARPLAEISDSTKSAIKWGHMVVIPLSAVIFGLLLLWIGKRRRQKLIAEILK